MTGELCKAVKCLNSRWYLKWLGSQAPIFFVLLFVDAGDVNLYWPRDSLVLRLSAMFRILHFLQCCTRLLFHRKYKQSDESEPKYLFISNVYSFIIRNRLSLTADPSWHWTNSGVHPGHVASSSKGVKHRDKQPVTFPFRMIDHSLSFGLWEGAGVPGENLQTPQDNGAQQGNELCPSQVSNPEPFCCKTTALTTEPPYCLCTFQKWLAGLAVFFMFVAVGSEWKQLTWCVVFAVVQVLHMTCVSDSSFLPVNSLKSEMWSDVCF